jgi:enoyl-CoA hydratase/carnithine racemase
MAGALQSATAVIEVLVTDGVGVVTLNRPEARNALSVALIAALTAALAELEADDAIDAVILTGADPAFCAGLDLKELGASGGILGDGRAEDEAARRGGPIPAMTKPLIGAINGAAITGGLEIALNCDFLVASERARFGDTHAQVGLHPGWGGAVLLTQAIGVRRARELSFTGRFAGAEEALRIGLVNHVVAHDELLPFCLQLAAGIRNADQPTLRKLRETYGLLTDAGWDIEAQAAREWQGRSFDLAAVEARRGAIRERGREQLR